jgi:hypothetical protein
MDRQNHLALLEEVQRDITAAEQSLVELQRLKSYLESKIGANGLGPKPDAPIPHSPNSALAISQGSPVHENLKGMSQARAAELVLRELGIPMKTMTLLDAMIQRGFPPPPSHRRQSLANSLFSVMRRKNDCFRKVGMGLWGLVEWGPNRPTKSEAGEENK